MNEKIRLQRTRFDDFAWHLLNPNVIRVIAVLLILVIAYAAYALGKASASSVEITQVSVVESKLTEPAKTDDISVMTLRCAKDSSPRLSLTGSGDLSLTVSGATDIEALGSDTVSLTLPNGEGQYDISYFGTDARVAWSTGQGHCVEDFASRAEER